MIFDNMICIKENGYEDQELAAAPSTVVNMDQNLVDTVQNSSLPCQEKRSSNHLSNFVFSLNL